VRWQLLFCERSSPPLAECAALPEHLLKLRTPSSGASRHLLPTEAAVKPRFCAMPPLILLSIFRLAFVRIGVSRQPPTGEGKWAPHPHHRSIPGLISIIPSSTSRRRISLRGKVGRALPLSPGPSDHLLPTEAAVKPRFCAMPPLILLSIFRFAFVRIGVSRQPPTEEGKCAPHFRNDSVHVVDGSMNHTLRAV
jgi:hypothetical protein